eukprot:jgi/Bigna1/129316/aug1.8_g4024
MDIQPDKDPRIDSGNDDHLVGESNRDSDDLKEKGNQRKEGATTEQSRTAVENDGAAELARNLEDKVTLIMATSPVKSNPSTVLLKHTMDSIRVYCKGATICTIRTYKLRKIIVCDGYSTTEEKNQKGVARKGRRIAEDKELIEQKEDPAFHKAETLVLPKLHGFGLAMKEALKLVKTPYVFVAQHDRCFSTKATGLDTLVQLLEKEPLVRYVGYLTHRYMFETGTIKVRSFPEPFAELEDKLKEHDKLSRSVMHTEGGKGEMPKDKETHQTSNEDNGTVMDDER